MNQPTVGTDSYCLFSILYLHISMITNISIPNIVSCAKQDPYSHVHSNIFILHLMLKKLLTFKSKTTNHALPYIYLPAVIPMRGGTWNWVWGCLCSRDYLHSMRITLHKTYLLHKPSVGRRLDTHRQNTENQSRLKTLISFKMYMWFCAHNHMGQGFYIIQQNFHLLMLPDVATRHV